MAARLQKEVEDLVLEVFERLPQTVDGFRDGDIAGSGMEVSVVWSWVDREESRDFVFYTPNSPACEAFHGEYAVSSIRLDDPEHLFRRWRVTLGTRVQ